MYVPSITQIFQIRVLCAICIACYKLNRFQSARTHSTELHRSPFIIFSHPLYRTKFTYIGLFLSLDLEGKVSVRLRSANIKALVDLVPEKWRQEFLQALLLRDTESQRRLWEVVHLEILCSIDPYEGPS